MAGKKPIVKVGQVTAPVVRTGGQVITGAFLIEGVELFIYDFNDKQEKWLIGAATILLCAVQNVLEKRQGRKLIGA